MKRSEILRKLQLLLIIACGTYPVLMVILERFAPELLGFGWLYSAGYVALALLGIRIPGRWRLTFGTAAAALATVLCIWLAPEGTVIGSGCVAILCSGLLLWSLQMGGWSQKQEIAVLWIAAGVLAQAVGQIALHVDRVSGGQGLARYSSMVLLSLIGFALLTMLSMNRNGLNLASGNRQSVPDVMRRKNALLIAGMFVLALLAALLPSIMSGLEDILKQAVLWVIRLIDMLFPEVPPAELEVGSDPTEGTGQVGAGADPGLTLNPIVEKIALFVGAVLSVLMLLFLLYQFYKILRSGLGKLITGFEKFSASVSEDYIDEVTDTREDISPEKLEKKRSGTRRSFLDSRNLPPSERIRLRYQRLMRKHPEWDAGATARETLPDYLAALYERARYSQHPVSEADAEQFVGGSKTV